MLPSEFKERMKKLLGDEADAFFAELENGKSVRSFRVNGIKAKNIDLENTDAPADRVAADFPPECFYTDEKFPGSLACHHSGIIYMQDPSAMATVHAVKIKEGAKILDSCSAPGGKTTQLVAMAGDGGIVVANEYDTKRCRILQSNIERLGARNTVVVNLDTAILADLYPNTFDVVLCDAPCSGEGMFRKNSLAIDEWSLENVEMCAERQREILGNVAKCVARGGKLIYSTCTFSLEENEMNLQWFLDNFSDFSLCDVEPELKNATSDGICFDGCRYDMTKARRFYPHVTRGEGQFIAVLEKSLGESSAPREKKKSKKDDKSGRKTKQELEEIRIAEQFLKNELVAMPRGELKAINGKIFLSPDIQLPEFGLFCAGVCVGEVVKSRLVPHHQLFSAYGELFCRKLHLSSRDERTKKYLCGEEISANGITCETGAKNEGWTAIFVDGVAVGGGKVSGGICKNHYPKGLRM